jgi:hypothetical protein
LKHTFSSTAIENSLIHNYLQYAVLEDKLETRDKSYKATNGGPLIPIGTFLHQVNNLPRSTITYQPHQWAVLLKIIQAAVAESKISILFPSASDDEWKAVADNLLILLADIVSNGLYPSSTQSDENEAEAQEMGWQSNINLRREQSSLLVPNTSIPNASQMSFDPEATLDLDMLEGTAALDGDEIKPITDEDTPQVSSGNDDNNPEAKVWNRNAIVAADIFIKCLEDEEILDMLKANGSEGGPSIIYTGDKSELLTCNFSQDAKQDYSPSLFQKIKLLLHPW